MKIETTSFEDSEAELRTIRETVFCLEQNVPRDIEWDGEDSDCAHVIAYDENNAPIGTGRIKPDGKIGRLAILKEYRQRGIGEKILNSLIDLARNKGLNQVYIHAQTHAESFYHKRGFAREGDEFIEADIKHIKMLLDITHI
ncbi:putative Acetyltransferase, GNAT family [Desulfamplus magnetovallimortis]|uniref:Putative Acetyltransferase, GNAT family n=1 Tax=Desulfamplus magnetovallimortis TaxID=1246637 RepID=A0A1W1HB01_9BACT|nr:GNAT family N-acetyltransferase [Desulfamplus magnetovallimortis]SLM29657.1 putative Acetyltransferase, GNAT family [Desulfamplus magnetovallimortis]